MFTRQRRPIRLLQNEVWEASALPLHDMPKDVLLDEGHAVLPSPASSLDLRRSRGVERRGGEQVLDCPGEGNRVVHGRSLARESGGVLPAIQ